jgi:hypothetical protein
MENDNDIYVLNEDEIALNKNLFTGREVIPRYLDRNVAEKYQTLPYTSETMKKIALFRSETKIYFLQQELGFTGIQTRRTRWWRASDCICNAGHEWVLCC